MVDWPGLTLPLPNEPTGELDSRTGREILSLSRLIVALHHSVVYDYAIAVYKLDDGKLTRCSPSKETSDH